MKNNWGNQDKMWPTKGHYLYKFAISWKDSKHFRCTSKALGSKSLSTEHAYIKMLQITQWKKSLSLHYFTAQNVYLHFIHVFVCICMHIYTHIKCTLNIFNMHIQIHFVTRRYHCHTNVLFYVSVCKHSCAHTGAGRCVFGWT